MFMGKREAFQDGERVVVKAVETRVRRQKLSSLTIIILGARAWVIL